MFKLPETLSNDCSFPAEQLLTDFTSQEGRKKDPDTAQFGDEELSFLCRLNDHVWFFTLAKALRSLTQGAKTRAGSNHWQWHITDGLNEEINFKILNYKLDQKKAGSGKAATVPKWWWVTELTWKCSTVWNTFNNWSSEDQDLLTEKGTYSWVLTN